MTEVVQEAEVVEPRTALVPAIEGNGAITPMTLLDRAITGGASIEVLTKLMDLQDRFDKTQARKAFDKAIAAAKAEIPPVIRNAKGHNDKKYADFAAIAKVVDPIITRHGLSYRFRTTQTEARINVTCVLSHEAGHSEENTLSGPADKTGSKNDIQAIGSTLTYLQRYSLVQALGIAAANDDDGQASGQGPTVSDEQVHQISALLTETKSNLDLFLKKIKLQSLSDIRADKFDEVMKMIRDVAAKRAAREGAKS